MKKALEVVKQIPAPVYYLAGAGIAAYFVLRLFRGGVELVNPASQNNLVNQAVTAGGRWSPGAALYNGVQEVGSWFGGRDDDDITEPVVLGPRRVDSVSYTATPYGNPPPTAEPKKDPDTRREYVTP